MMKTYRNLADYRKENLDRYLDDKRIPDEQISEIVEEMTIWSSELQSYYENPQKDFKTVFETITGKEIETSYVTQSIAFELMDSLLEKVDDHSILEHMINPENCFERLRAMSFQRKATVNHNYSSIEKVSIQLGDNNIMLITVIITNKNNRMDSTSLIEEILI